MKREHLTNDELLASLHAAMRDESVRLASVIAMLIEVEDRRLDSALACPSLFEFCTRKLGMSGGQAFRRTAAARLARQFPQVLDAIRERRIHISNLVVVRHLVTRENVTAMLNAIAGKSRRELEALAARLDPKPDAPSFVRKQPERSASAASAPPPQLYSAPLLFAASTPTTSPATPSSPHTTSPAAPSSPPTTAPARPGISSETASTPSPANGPAPIRAGVGPTPSPSHVRPAPPPIPPAAQLTPLSEARHKVQFTVSTEQRNKIERALQLARHRNVTGDLAKVVEEAIDLYVAKLEKERFAAVSRPRKNIDAAAATATSATSAASATSASATAATAATATSASAATAASATSATSATATSATPSASAIPAAVRRAVFERDGERCTFVSEHGERCSARTLLEIDHVHPRALGGAHDVANLRVLCRAHNRLAAERVFGRDHIQRTIEARRQRKRPSASRPSNGTPIAQKQPLLFRSETKESASSHGTPPEPR